MFTIPFVLLALSASTLATVFTTEPVASSVFTGGKPASISWQDDGSAPSLKDFGPATVSIYVGNAQQQTRLQAISTVDVSSVTTVQFTPDATIGPNSNEYFIRFESASLKDPKQPQFPALAFSAKFTMNGMTGTFSPDVQAQIAGQSTAPLAGATTPAAAPSGGPSTAGATTSTSASAISSKASSNAASATKGAASATSTKSNAGINVKAGWFGVFFGVAVGASMF